MKLTPGLDKIAASALDYAKPIVLGSLMGAGAGAVTAPRGQAGKWARNGAVIGAIASGPAQVGLKRILQREKTLKELAESEIPHQNTADIFKWTGIGAGVGAGVTAATGGYKHPDRSSSLGQAADLGLDIGDIVIRSL